MPLLAAMPMGALILDHQQSVISVNHAFLELLGYKDTELLGRTFGDFVKDAHAQVLHGLLNAPEDQQVRLELRFVKAGAETLTLAVVFSRFIEDGQGSPRLLAILADHLDLTTIRDTERRLLQSAAVYAATSEGVLITDAEGLIVAINPAFTRITGYTESEILGRKPNLLNSHWHPHSYFVGMWRLLSRHGYWHGSIWNRRKDGEIYLQKLTIRRVLDAHDNLINFVGVFADRGHSPPRRVNYLIHYDALTKLPNRLLFESRLEHAIELGRRKKAPLALVLFDLDHFSHINTSLGHQIGDELLRTVALRLRVAIRPADTLARLRADQFGLLFEDIGRLSDVEEIAQRLQAILRSAIPVRNHQVFLTASIGIVFDVGMGDDSNAMLAHAESVLRLVKHQGRNGFRVSQADSGDAAHEHQRLLDLLRTGLDKGEYRLMYRPRVDMETGLQEGVEVLIRWDQRELGTIPPERFLPLANDSGFMVELGQWALTAACRQIQNWLLRGLPIGDCSIHISEAQLTRGNLLHVLALLLEDNPGGANRLELEFSESLLQKHPEQIVEVFDGVRRLGVSITLNEVGASWTSPAILQRLPIKTLKLHAAFIESLPDSRDDLAVVQALIAIAQALDLEILADGVRTDAQRQLLLTIGCRQALGVLFGEPMFATQFERGFDPRPCSLPPNALEN
jgi:diguanylate cyclase (GGDEF)-like protein/PAS domain S-box-containing protein